MKVESGLELTLPTVDYGNVKLYTRVSLDSVSDLGRVEEAQKKFGIKGDKASSDVMIEAARKLALEELCGMKREVDRLAAATFSLETK